MNTDWRVIGLEQHNAFMNMALDEACAESVAARDSMPTIRFYRWLPSAVSIGYFQSLESEVNMENCAEAGVDVVRRRTGGGAVYHDYEGEITYSIIGPVQWFPRGITESYHLICGYVIDALNNLGIKSEFKPINDIILSPAALGPNGERVGGKKISGNAQTRRNGILLQHGTILYTVDVRKMFSVLRVSAEKISDKMIAAAEDRVTSLKNLRPELELMDLYKALLNAFTYHKNFEMGEWTLAELEKAHDLAENRYRQKEWNAMR
jgi:lipoate---protein ligase